MRAQQRQCEHQQQQDGRIYPFTYYLHVSIYLAMHHSHSARSPALSLISFFPIIIKRACSKRTRGRSESLSATPEVRRRAPSVPQSRPPPSFTDPLRAAAHLPRGTTADAAGNFPPSHPWCDVLRTCSQRFGPLALWPRFFPAAEQAH